MDKIESHELIVRHIDTLKGILIACVAPREAITLLELVRFNYIHTEERLAGLLRLETRIEEAKPIKKQALDAKIRAKILDYYYTKKMKPSEIAKLFENMDGTKVSNIISMDKNKKKK